MIGEKNEQTHSIEAEQGLLGSFLMYKDAVGVACDIVEAQHFFEPIHREIFDICKILFDQGKNITPVSVKPFISPGFKLGTITLGEYVARLAAESCALVMVADYARIIRDFSDRRMIADIGKTLEVESKLVGTESGSGAKDLAAWAVDMLDGIASAHASNAVPAVTLDQAITHAVDKTAAAYQNDGKLVGIPTGLRDLDAKTLGAGAGNLIVLAGRPGMGKTAIAVTITRNKARAGYRGIFFSLEMGDDELGMRMISDEMYDVSKLQYWQIRSGRYHERYFEGIRDAALRLQGLPLKIEQQPGLTVAQIAARARQYKRRHGLDYLVVDHLLLIKGSDRYKGNRVYEIGEITGSLKALAKELGIPIYLLCQLSRGVETREDKRPMLSDLRDSGAIEQDADTVIFLYRPAYYLDQRVPPGGTSEYLIWADEMEKVHDRLDAIIAKQRSGPLGTVRLFCDIGSNAIRDRRDGEPEPDLSLMSPDDTKAVMT